MWNSMLESEDADLIAILNPLAPDYKNNSMQDSMIWLRRTTFDRAFGSDFAVLDGRSTAVIQSPVAIALAYRSAPPRSTFRRLLVVKPNPTESWRCTPS